MKKKMFLLPSLVVTGAALPLLAVACQNEEGNYLETLTLNKQINPINQFFLDTTAEKESNISPNESLEKTATAAVLFRIQTLSSPEYAQDGTLAKVGNVKYKLELAKDITFTFEDGSTKVYDNDNSDPVAESKDGNPYAFQMSNDEHSINSQSFRNDAKKAIKMAVSVKDNIYWYDSNGNKTEYKVVAEDFWFSYLRSYYSGFFQRYFKGDNGSYSAASERDAEAKKRFNDTNGLRFGGALFTNGQQFDINGLDAGKFVAFNNDDENEATNAIKNNTLVFDAIQKDGIYGQRDFFSYFDLMLNKSLVYAAAPSQYLRKLAATEYKESKEENAKNLYGEKILNKIGFYFYGASGLAKNLYAGAYLPNARKSNDNTLVLKRNDEYYKNGLLDKTSLKQIKINYGNIDSTLTVNNFKNKTNTILNFDELSKENQSYFEKEIATVNALKYKNYQKAKSIGSSAFNITPKPTVVTEDGVKKINYEEIAFNENYAKLVYGASIAEINKGFRGESYENRKSISSGVFDEQSISFRSLINAAINWEYVKDKDSNTSRDLWLSNAAPDALLGGSDQLTSKYKTARDAKDLINKLMPIDHEGNLINLEELTKNEEYQNTYKSVYFDALKDKIKATLDAFYTKNNLSLDQKIKWFIYNDQLIDEKQTQKYEAIVNTIKELDSRLEPVFKKLATKKDLDEVIGNDNGTGNNSINQRISYSYEFDTLSPYLDKITHAIGLSPFALWKKFANLEANDKLAIAFPELTRFAKELKAKQESGEFKYNEIYVGGENPAKDAQLFKTIVWDDLDKFNSYEERELYLKGVLVNKDGILAWSSVGFGGLGYKYAGNGVFEIDNIVEQSKFARYFVSHSTNEQLVNLLRELNTWRTFDITIDKYVESLNSQSIYLTHKGFNIVVPYNNVTYVQDYSVEEKNQ